MARNRSKGPFIKGTYYLTKAGVETTEVRAKILQRRLQILVHSAIYYGMGESLVSDHTWNMWAQELVKLQKENPTISKRVDYHEAFENFDGSTGFDLPYRHPEIMAKAQYLLNIHKRRENIHGTIGNQTNRPDPGNDVIRLFFPK